MRLLAAREKNDFWTRNHVRNQNRKHPRPRNDAYCIWFVLTGSAHDSRAIQSQKRQAASSTSFRATISFLYLQGLSIMTHFYIFHAHDVLPDDLKSSTTWLRCNVVGIKRVFRAAANDDSSPSVRWGTGITGFPLGTSRNGLLEGDRYYRPAHWPAKPMRKENPRFNSPRQFLKISKTTTPYGEYRAHGLAQFCYCNAALFQRLTITLLQ